MKIVVISRSDSTGGAAIVSRRLTEALRQQDIKAGMLVLEKRTDLPYIVEARYPFWEPYAFLRERAQIFLHNGFSKENLWKADTAQFGLPLWEHPMVLEADAIILNYVNQGMLSLDGIAKMSPPGKRVIWTMHDMWNLTGVCHHAMDCTRYREQCGCCPILKSKSPSDLSHATWARKDRMYRETNIKFVAVSRWLASKASESSLFKEREVTVIPNPFEPAETPKRRRESSRRILFAAATLDNWIKGLSTFKESVRIFKEKFPSLAKNAEVVLMGAVKNPANLEGFALPTVIKGSVSSEAGLAEVYSGCDVIVNSSYFENLPGTLVEGQAYGVVPVAFDRGGQRDIIDHKATGYLAQWNDNEHERASRLAEGIAFALRELSGDPEAIRERMLESVRSRFSYKAVAEKYLSILAPLGPPRGGIDGAALRGVRFSETHKIGMDSMSSPILT